MHSFQGWIFFSSEYFPGVNSFLLGEGYFSGVKSFQWGFSQFTWSSSVILLNFFVPLEYQGNPITEGFLDWHFLEFSAIITLIITVAAKISPAALGCPLSLTCESNQVEVIILDALRHVCDVCVHVSVNVCVHVCEESKR